MESQSAGNKILWDRKTMSLIRRSTIQFTACFGLKYLHGIVAMTIFYLHVPLSSGRVLLSLVKSKHLVICNTKPLSTREERALLSWRTLIGVPESTVT